MSHRNSIIQDGGINKIPREFDVETGLKNNVRKRESQNHRKDSKIIL